MTHTLSKSTLMRGLQCPKNLWLHIHRRELEPAVDAATQMQFDEGNEVGELAREHYKNQNPGEQTALIDTPYWDFQQAHDKTQALINQGVTTIFEAAFLTNNLFARADILTKRQDGWHMIEVKKGTKVKDDYTKDATVQTHIVERAGLKLKSVSIMHINNQVTYPNLDELFTIQDITAEVRALEPEIAAQIQKLTQAAQANTEPQTKIGPHCDTPHECPFKGYCWKDVPAKTVLDLPVLSKEKKWELFNDGVKLIKDLEAKKYKDLVRRAIEVTQSGENYVDAKAIHREIKKWKWPLYFFDFETIGPAIPRYNGTKPYAAVPFQFSCHVWRDFDSDPTAAKLEHFEYLHTSATDPRDALISAMLLGLGEKGSIVAYFASFEIGVIQKLAEYDRVRSKQLLALAKRFVDPLPIFRAHVYHSEFRGSFSLKSVAPALIGSTLSYDSLDVGDGTTAQAWANHMLRGTLPAEEITHVTKSLLAYCRQDTLAMVELVKWLMAQCRS